MGVKGYKAFEKGMKCKGKQYEENTTYEEFGDSICNEGVMHFCENPFYVLNYYPLIDENGDFSEFAKVEALGNVYSQNDKLATNKIHIGAKLDFKSFIKACIDFTLEKTKLDSSDVCTEENIDSNSAQIGSSGDCAQIGSSGNYAQIGSSGDYAKIGSSGNCAQIGSSGNSAQIGSSGDYAQIGSSGDYAQIGSSGDYAKIGSSGNYAQIGSSGNYAKIGSSGDYAKISSYGKNSVVMAAGYRSIARAKIGSWITLAEWIKTNETTKDGFSIWKPICVKTEYVDGTKIKEDTFYKLVDGEFKEINNEK